jgi:alcohol dehydrogenase
MSDFDEARRLLYDFKGEAYLYGPGVLPQLGSVARSLGRRTAMVVDRFPGSEQFLTTIRDSMAAAGLVLVAEIDGAGPNAPREDLYRITEQAKAAHPDVLVSFGGGSTIDSAKAAEVLRRLGGEIDEYFGTGLVTGAMTKSGRSLTPHVAVQTAASSGAHLTKYSNITDISSGQKKLIVDEAIVPVCPVFDYCATYGAPPSLSADGALDGIAHSLEVLYGSAGSANYPTVKRVAVTSIRLVVNYLPQVIECPANAEARNALCLATDLGGYAIMLGGTNGGHLTSFSLVDILSHGRACAMMNPYYTVFFAPAIGDQLRIIGAIYREAGYTTAPLERLRGRDLGLAIAEAMIQFARRIGFPTQLDQVEGFGDQHIARALAAAKNPQLKMKLENMPVPLSSEMVDDYMGPVLEAARDGDLSLIRNVN